MTDLIKFLEDMDFQPDPIQIRGIGLLTMLTDNLGNNLLEGLTPGDNAIITDKMQGRLYPFQADDNELETFKGRPPNQGLLIHYNITPEIFIPYIVGSWTPPEENNSETLRTTFHLKEKITGQQTTPTMVRTLHDLNVICFDTGADVITIENNGTFGIEGINIAGEISRALGGTRDQVFREIAYDYDISDGTYLSSATLHQHGNVFIKLNDPRLITKLIARKGTQLETSPSAGLPWDSQP